jgi:hypothetical protein
VALGTPPFWNVYLPPDRAAPPDAATVPRERSSPYQFQGGQARFVPRRAGPLLRVGVIVKLQNLKTHTDLNGQSGVVVAPRDRDGKYQIELLYTRAEPVLIGRYDCGRGRCVPNPNGRYNSYTECKQQQCLLRVVEGNLAPAPGSRCVDEQGSVVTALNAIMQHITVREQNKDTVVERTRLHGCSHQMALRQKSPA